MQQADTPVSNAAPENTSVVESIETTQEKVGISFVWAVVLSLLVGAALLSMYHFLVAPKPIQFALLDVQKLSSSIENEARQAIVNNLDATPEQRASAAATYENKLRALQDVINKIGKECDCVLLVKAAALNTNANKLRDYTPSAEKLLGLAPSAQTQAAPAPAPAPEQKQ